MLITNFYLDTSSNMVVPVERELEFPLVPYWRREFKHYSVTFESYDGKLYMQKQIRKRGEELISTVLDADSGDVVKEITYLIDGDFVSMKHFTDRYACAGIVDGKWDFIWYENDKEKWRTKDSFAGWELINNEFVATMHENRSLVVLDPATGALLRQVAGVQLGNREVFDDNTKVLYNSTANSLVCRDFRTFELLWAFDLQQFEPDEKEISVRYRIADGYIYCQCGGKAFCLEAQTGKLVWLTDVIGGIMHVKDKKLYLTGLHEITCINGATGHTIYITPYKKNVPEGWNSIKRGVLYRCGLVVGKYLFTNEHEWMFSVADLDTGEVIWEVPKKGHFEGGMMYLDGKLYISSYPHLWCFGPKEGQPAEARKKRLGSNLKWEDLRGIPNPT